MKPATVDRSVSISWIIRLPMMTPSAIRATCLACSGVDMPKPTQRGWVATFLTLATNAARSAGRSVPGTGNAGYRDQVDKPPRPLSHQPDALLGAGRRQQVDEVKALPPGDSLQPGAFLRGQVGDDQTINPGPGAGADRTPPGHS